MELCILNHFVLNICIGHLRQVQHNIRVNHHLAQPAWVWKFWESCSITSFWCLRQVFSLKNIWPQCLLLSYSDLTPSISILSLIIKCVYLIVDMLHDQFKATTNQCTLYTQFDFTAKHISPINSAYQQRQTCVDLRVVRRLDWRARSNLVDGGRTRRTLSPFRLTLLHPPPFSRDDR